MTKLITGGSHPLLFFLFSWTLSGDAAARLPEFSTNIDNHPATTVQFTIPEYHRQQPLEPDRDHIDLDDLNNLEEEEEDDNYPKDDDNYNLLEHGRNLAVVTEDLKHTHLKLRYAFYDSKLFERVQTEHIFEDSKTFVDCIAKRNLDEIMRDFDSQNPKDLKQFVLTNFYLPNNSSQTNAQEISNQNKDKYPFDIRFQNYLIDVLKYDITKYFNVSINHSNSSLLYLPYPTLIPGGRFREWYYWDSYLPFVYFIKTGKPDDKQFALGMLNNIKYLLEQFGFVPTGNRDYYLGRSQPPVYSLMVEELLKIDQSEALKHLPTLVTSFKSWTDYNSPNQTPLEGTSLAGRHLANTVSHTRTLGDAAEHDSSKPEVRVYVYNSAWGDHPRPEMFAEDIQTAKDAAQSTKSKQPEYPIFQEIQASCESGWDFSSRFEGRCFDLECLETTQIAPIDLQAFMQHHAALIVKLLKVKETTVGPLDDQDKNLLNEYEKHANSIAHNIVTHFWDENLGAFSDIIVANGSSRHMLSPAAALPILVNVTGIDQYKVKRTLETIRDGLLFTGGVAATSINVTTDVGPSNSADPPKSQQWDKPMGWAPLQWFVYQAALLNGHADPDLEKIAVQIRSGWVNMVKKVFKESGLVYEKYNVADMTRGDAGEYKVQAGFAFTNAVTLLFLQDMTETTITL